ncbi:MAG: MFS transporter [Firmicutes bacterium]|nr:MFS transporter [Bacillota bacterium]
MNVKTQRGSLAVLFGGLFVVMVGFGVIIPVLPFYVLHFGATSVHLGLLMATYSTMQFIFAPVWGVVSDRVGRKPVLLLGLGGFVVSFTVFALATRLWMLFAARALAGVLSSATLPAAMAYIGDVTPEDRRGEGWGCSAPRWGSG